MADEKQKNRMPETKSAGKKGPVGQKPVAPEAAVQGQASRAGNPPGGLLDWLLSATHSLFSRTARQATQMRKHVWKILCAQRDILSPQAVEAVKGALQTIEDEVGRRAPKPVLVEAMNDLEKVANKWLKAYPFPAWRENIDVLLVAIAVALGIRTFFLQPFKIPTGSMQPTLYGITSNPDYKRNSALPANPRPSPDFEIPNPVDRFLTYWFRGISYTQIKAVSDGSLQAVEKPTPFLLFKLKQRFQVGDQWYTVWFPTEDLLERAGLIAGGQPNTRVFKTGEDIIKIKVISGDHLFVDRLTYNFRRPRRGEIIVFQTQGISYPQVPQDQYYIKRLVGLGPERISIGADQHLRIDGRRLDASVPGFENVYSFKPDAGENEYFGHLPLGLFAENEERSIRPRHYMVMGDNTRNSLDSRYFGDFSREFVIGKAFFVYWPIGSQDKRPSRFGWGTR